MGRRGGGIGVAMATTMSGRMGVGKREKGGGRTGGGPHRYEGEGGRGNEREESKLGPTSRVHTFEVIVAERVVGVGVDVAGVT